MPEQDGTLNSNPVSNFYYNQGLTTVSSNGYFQLTGTASSDWGISSYVVEVDSNGKKKSGIHPVLYFKYIKSKFGLLEKIRLDSRLKKLEKAFYEAVDAGQDALGNKLLTELARETRESLMYAKGIRHFIERDDLVKHKNKIRDGHISDTVLKDFTRVIPKAVLEKKEKVRDLFDNFVIYHYWDEKAEENRTKKQKITPEEKAKLRDPVLFGIIKETNRLYFIADWEDEFCDLTFDEMVDVLGKDDEELTLSSKPKLT